MSSLATEKDKIKQICDIIKSETLQPAKEEAQQILEVAGQEAQRIIREAETQAEELLQSARTRMEHEKALFQNAMTQAARQGIEALRQDIEEKLFQQGLSEWLRTHLADPHLAARLITALVNAVEKEGIGVQLSAYIASQVSAEEVNALLLHEVVDKLREKSVVVGTFTGGVQLKIEDQHLILDMSDQAIKELLVRYLVKEFRELLFQA